MQVILEEESHDLYEHSEITRQQRRLTLRNTPSMHHQQATQLRGQNRSYKGSIEGIFCAEQHLKHKEKTSGMQTRYAGKAETKWNSHPNIQIQISATDCISMEFCNTKPKRTQTPLPATTKQLSKVEVIEKFTIKLYNVAICKLR